MASSSNPKVETLFTVHGLFEMPDFTQLEAGIAEVVPQSTRHLRATYFDSADLRLARERITLRQRGAGAQHWTLQLPVVAGSNETGWDEVRIPGNGTKPPGDLCDLLTARLRGVPLLAVAVLVTERRGEAFIGTDGRPLAEVIDETISLMNGRRVAARFRQLRIEQQDGGQLAAQAAARALVEAGAGPSPQLPKVVRVLGPRAQNPSDLPVPDLVSAQSPASALVLWSLRDGLARIVGADIGVRRFEHDAVHQMRVACRRLRSDLRTFGPLLDDDRIATLREELAWLGDALGACRDLEVLRARLSRTAAIDPLLPVDAEGLATLDALLAAQEDAARPQALECLRSPRYVNLLELLIATARDPVFTPLADGSCADVLPALVRAPWVRLARRGRRLAMTDPDDSWHSTRILAKKARYAAEAAAVAFGRPAARTAAAAAVVQEILGEHQDGATAAERVLAIAAEHPDDSRLALTCGRIAERERARVTEARTSFHKQWKRLSARGRLDLVELRNNH